MARGRGPLSVRALYRRDQALPYDLPPTAVERAEDRWDAATWAENVLADPHTLILEIGTIRDIDDPIDDPHERAVLCELTICSTTREPLLDTLINPTWPWLPAKDLAKQQVTDNQLRAAPTFHHLRPTVADLLRGRRVVCLDRARIYGVLFSELEWCAGGVCDANGALRGEHQDMLTRLSTVRFACLRLARSRFVGAGDSRCRPRLVEGISEPTRASDRAHAALNILGDRPSTRERDSHVADQGDHTAPPSVPHGHDGCAPELTMARRDARAIRRGGGSMVSQAMAGWRSSISMVSTPRASFSGP
ncbi:hypothetical protein [Nonomuraea sp. LPB2021202275-12-8]|uniref:hypothetical protein n=1 Tax=Nonomuraea sp. LPB2021202275-12-8 TaxID=3120159 RepID=UPI00300D5236